jgi:hypothetical protein
LPAYWFQTAQTRKEGSLEDSNMVVGLVSIFPLVLLDENIAHK